MRRCRWPFLATLVSAALLAPALSCREPTQAIISITTLLRCDELTEVDITVASTTPRAKADFEFGSIAATSVGCHNGKFGDLLVTPASGSGAVQVVVGAKAPLVAIYGSDFKLSRACSEHPEYCIVARRKFFFISAATITVPVALEADCRGVVCEALSTCQRGGCVDALVQCSGTDCTIPSDAPADAAARLDDGSTGTRSDANAGDGGGRRDGGDSDGGGSDASDAADGGHNLFCGNAPAHCGLSCEGASFCCRTISAPTITRCTPAGAPCLSPTEVPSCCDGTCDGTNYCGRPALPNAAYLCTPTIDISYDYICQTLADCPPGASCVVGGGNIKHCIFGMNPH